MFVFATSLLLTAAAAEPSRLHDQPGDYAALHIDRKPAWREDGMRTDGGRGSFEWWYTDAEFEDGTTVVLVFFTKDGFDIPGPAHPTVLLEVTLPDGRRIERTVQGTRGEVLDAEVEDARVKVEDCSLHREDNRYIVTFDDGEVTYRAEMVSTLPPFRPHTGRWTFGADEVDHFSWFVAQPAADIEATLTVDGETRKLQGHGYHDHNWGNVAMNKVMNHWYWGRATVGDLSLIVVDIVTEKRFGYERRPLVMLAEGGQLLEGDPTAVEVTRSGTHTHPFTKKFVDDDLTFSRTVADGRTFEVELHRERDITQTNLLDGYPWLTRSLARLAGVRPTYLRMLGTVKLNITQPDGTMTSTTQTGLWEQMFFGKDREMAIGD